MVQGEKVMKPKPPCSPKRTVSGKRCSQPCSKTVASLMSSGVRPLLKRRFSSGAKLSRPTLEKQTLCPASARRGSRGSTRSAILRISSRRQWKWKAEGGRLASSTPAKKRWARNQISPPWKRNSRA